MAEDMDTYQCTTNGAYSKGKWWISYGQQPCSSKWENQFMRKFQKTLISKVICTGGAGHIYIGIWSVSIYLFTVSLCWIIQYLGVNRIHRCPCKASKQLPDISAVHIWVVEQFSQCIIYIYTCMVHMVTLSSRCITPLSNLGTMSAKGYYRDTPTEISQRGKSHWGLPWGVPTSTICIVSKSTSFWPC